MLETIRTFTPLIIISMSIIISYVALRINFNNLTKRTIFIEDIIYNKDHIITEQVCSARFNKLEQCILNQAKDITEIRIAIKGILVSIDSIEKRLTRIEDNLGM